MKKKLYIRPRQTEEISLEPTDPLLAISEGEIDNISVYTGESQEAGNALTKDNPFDYMWE